MKKQVVSLLAMATVSVLMSGCASVQRAMPSAPGMVNINLEKGDYTMLGTVKGSSTVKTYVFGVVQIVDGTKVRVLWVFKDYEDQYSYQNPDGLGQMLGRVSVADRAYYKALAATPDADVVIPKSLVKQTSGFPYIYEEEEATFSGKALKYKSE
jgi:uncharacterized protein YceK